MRFEFITLLCFAASAVTADTADTADTVDTPDTACGCGPEYIANSWGCGSPNIDQNFCELIGVDNQWPVSNFSRSKAEVFPFWKFIEFHMRSLEANNLKEV